MERFDSRKSAKKASLEIRTRILRVPESHRGLFIRAFHPLDRGGANGEIYLAFFDKRSFIFQLELFLRTPSAFAVHFAGANRRREIDDRIALARSL